ncbi:SOSS complex subunit C-like [Amphiura filiformis]|uniref:SOSS complex subunit C-like n=1 Tax=Amphiura filiformis TaxID=82378 RepID=UPI003B2256CB
MSGPGSGQEQQNRKILEDLQQQKKRLRMMHSQPNSAIGGQVRATKDSSEVRHLQAQQKQALEHAHTNSFAYFTTQDSSFGNLILPVLPRLPPE